MRYSFIWCFILIATASFADAVILKTQSVSVSSDKVSVYKADSAIKIAVTKEFVKLNSSSISLPENDEGYYIKFELINQTNTDQWFIGIPLAYLDAVLAYEIQNGSPRLLSASNDHLPLFELNLLEGRSRTIILYVKSSKQYNIPIIVSKRIYTQRLNLGRNLLIGCFLGVMLAMFLYNIFIGISTRQKEYVPYILYVFFITIAQIRFLGIEDYFLPDDLRVRDAFLYLGSAFSGLFGTFFAVQFLNIKRLLPKILPFYWVVVLIYVATAILFICSYTNLAYRLIQLGGLSSAVVFVISCVLLLKKNFKPARVYLLAWFFLMIGLVAYSLRDFGLLEANIWVNISFPFGVAIETILLSLALANRINTLKLEKEDSDQRVIDEVKKNEELVINQNIILEKKVKERTLELEQALNSLKAAQSRLVQSEKMASLGVLTAGIAHEINNPINFVSANVIPLKENIEILTKLLKEYKQINVTNPIEELERIERMEEEFELDYLLKETDMLIDGIEEGARRTHSIVDGLKTFSRGDGSELALADINTGIISTLSVLKSKVNGIKVNLMLDENLPLLYCQIGKLNQVFLNIINNALDALDEEYGANSKNSSISITTYLDKKYNVCIAVKDNAAGISAENIEKLFEPFFTTKAIGKGTGLGLAISYGIVEEHNGTITIDSEVGKGTTFVVSIPQTRS